MAEIGAIQKTENGDLFQLTVGGWEAISVKEAQRELAPAISRFARGFTGEESGRGLAGTVGRMTGIAELVTGTGQILGGGARLAGRMVGRQRMADRVAEAIPTGGPAASPGGGFAGAIDEAAPRLTGPAGTAPGGVPGGGAAGGAGGAAGGRVNLAGIINEYQDVADGLARGDVGAAANRSRSIPIPIVREVAREIDKIKMEIIEPADLNDLQRAMAPVMKDLGMQFLPGQLQGSKFMLQAVSRHPALMAEFAPEREITLDRFASAVKRSIGVPETTPTTGGMFGRSDNILGQGFNDIRDNVVGRHGLNIDDIETVTPLLEVNQRRVLDLNNLNGSELMQVRSRMNKQASDMFGAGQQTAGEDLMNVISRIDEIILSGLNKGKGRQWRLLREQWKVKMMFQRGKGFGSAGEFNPTTLDSSARRMFTEYSKSDVLTVEGTGLRQETVDVLNWIKGMQAFADNTPNSGTPMGASIIDAINSPKQWLIGRATARWVRSYYEKGQPDLNP